jgi:predicted HicB family RNase H-like nuclease
VPRINYDLDPELHRRAKAAAAQQGRTLKAWIERAILAAVEQHERDEERRTAKRR